MPGSEQPSRFALAQPKYKKKIQSFAGRKYIALPGTDRCELEQELLEVLWLCCMSYDPDKGAKFSTYFWTSAKRRFLDLHKAASTQKRVGDYQRISMSQEDVQAVVEAAWDAPSAEDEAMALINVREIYRSGRTPL